MQKRSVYFEKDNSHINDLVLTISMLPLSPNKVKAAEIETEKMDIPQEVLNSLPEEIQSILSGEKNMSYI